MLNRAEPEIAQGDGARIRAAVERLANSSALSNSPQLVNFLRFVVEETLAGRGERLKAYTIATAALGRGGAFDPQKDPIVRVEAARLRAALTRYYNGFGHDDPLIIEIARGNYVPVFKDRPVPTFTQRTAATAERWRMGLWLMSPFARRFAAAAIILAFVAGTTIYVARSSEGNAGRRLTDIRADDITGTIKPVMSPINAKLPVGPVVSITPVNTVGAANPAAIAPGALLAQLCDAFARFDDVNIVASEAQCSGHNAAQPAAGSMSRADYSFGATIDYQPDGTVNLRFRLIDADTSTVVWLSSVNDLSKSDNSEVIVETVGKLATTLFQPFGVVQARERVKFAAGRGGDPRYRCLLRADDYLHSFDPKLHDGARDCLEDAVARNPTFASGYVQLARIYFREYQFGYGVRLGEAPPLERARAAACRAAELKPTSARAHFVLADIALAGGDVATAKEHGAKSVALNPYDMPIMFHYGANFILLGEIDKGLAIIDHVATTSAVPPGRLNLIRFVAAYLKGDVQAAAAYARLMKGKPDLDYFASALLAAKNGDRAQARQAFQQLIAIAPAWRRDTEGELRKLFPAPGLVERLAGDLSAGLRAAN